MEASAVRCEAPSARMPRRIEPFASPHAASPTQRSLAAPAQGRWRLAPPLPHHRPTAPTPEPECRGGFALPAPPGRPAAVCSEPPGSPAAGPVARRRARSLESHSCKQR